MAIATKLLGTGQFEHHLLTRNQKKNTVKKVLFTGLMLTSLVDMFSMLVCFLLQTFSTTPEIYVAKDIRLAESISGKEVKSAPVLSVSRTGLFLDQKDLGRFDQVMKSPDVLVQRLGQLRRQWAKENPGKAYPGEINLQADKEMPSTEVARLMGILNTQHFDVIKLAVMGN